jgi:hypothetical protein
MIGDSTPRWFAPSPTVRAPRKPLYLMRKLPPNPLRTAQLHGFFLGQDDGGDGGGDGGNGGDGGDYIDTVVPTETTSPDVLDTLDEGPQYVLPAGAVGPPPGTSDDTVIGSSGLTVGQLLAMGYSTDEVSTMIAQQGQMDAQLAQQYQATQQAAAQQTQAGGGGGGQPSSGGGGGSKGGGGQPQQAQVPQQFYQPTSQGTPLAPGPAPSVSTAQPSAGNFLTESTLISGVPNIITLLGGYLLVTKVISHGAQTVHAVRGKK